MYSHDLSSPNSVSIGSVYEISPAGVARLLTWQLRAPRATKAIAARAAALLVKAGVWLGSDQKKEITQGLLWQSPKETPQSAPVV